MSEERAGERWARALLDRWGLTVEHLVGIRFAINVFIATIIVWGTLKALGHANPIWAIASMVAASDPAPGEARRLFYSRLVNVAVGCAVGFVFLVLGATSDWALPFALAVTVLVSSYIIRIKTMWRQAPITAAVVIAAGLTAGDVGTGVSRGLSKVEQVIFGCFVGVVVSMAMSRVWRIRIEPSEGAG